MTRRRSGGGNVARAGTASRVVGAWNAFWFTPSDGATLALMRILAGLMLGYTHIVWGLDLRGFIGSQGRLSAAHFHEFFVTPDQPHGNLFAWSHLPWIEGSGALMAVHWLSLTVFVALIVGFQTRLAAILAFLLTVSYSHRLAAAQFGLDQINGLLALYLSVGRSGAVYSWDAWWARRRTRGESQITKITEYPRHVDTTIAIRLVQVHMCVIYLFAGCGKLLGVSWWDGTALWGAFANREYQTIDMTWMVHHELLVNFLTHLVVAWEVAYCFLIWRPACRPIMLALAVPLHLGIAVCMGMITFGLIMLVANLAFVRPNEVRWLLNRLGITARGPGGERGATRQSARQAVEAH